MKGGTDKDGILLSCFIQFFFVYRSDIFSSILVFVLYRGESKQNETLSAN